MNFMKMTRRAFGALLPVSLMGLMGCSSKPDAYFSIAREDLPKDVAMIVEALEQAAPKSDIGVIPVRFANYRSLREPQEVIHEITEDVPLCRSLIGRDIIIHQGPFNNPSAFHRVIASENGSVCDVRFEQLNEAEVARYQDYYFTEYKASNPYEALAQEVIERESLRFDHVLVRVNRKGQLKSMSFKIDQPWLFLHGNPTKDGKKLRTAYYYNFTLNRGKKI